MDNMTCVIDARTLVDNIHEIKQWVYGEYIRLYLPLCTSEKVDQLYKASIPPKETQKEPQPKRSSYKAASRKDYPLFDINPRVAKEFLSRAQSDTTSHGVKFQLPNEQFTAWKEVEKVVEKSETVEERPTSFAQALLSKLNLANDTGKSSNGVKDPPKPRLVARDSGNPRSPWKINKKVPILSPCGVPDSIKPLLSCALWRLYEYDDDPLTPETLVLLSDDLGMNAVAQKLGIPTRQVLGLRQLVHERILAKGGQNVPSDLERDFPMKYANNLAAEDGDDQACVQSEVRREENPFDVAEKVDVDGEIQISKEVEATEAKMIEGAPMDVKNEEEVEEKESSLEAQTQCTVEITNDDSEKTNGAMGVVDAPLTVSETSGGTSHPSLQISQQATTNVVQPVILDVQSDETQDLGHNESEPTITTLTNGHKPVTAIESDDDSDDEVVLFNPKAKRLSGMRTMPAEPPKPGIITIHGHGRSNNNAQTARTSHSPVREKQENAAIEKSDMRTPEHFDIKAARVIYRPSPEISRNSTPEHFTHEATGRSHSSAPYVPYVSNNHPAPKHQRQRSRKVMASPAIIDPDAFDRFTLTATRSSNNNDNRRASPRVSPRRAPRTLEPEVDYVLKSGSPRGSTRGRGKLWIP